VVGSRAISLSEWFAAVRADSIPLRISGGTAKARRSRFPEGMTEREAKAKQGQRPRFGQLLAVAVALYEHEVRPGFGVGGLIALPGEAGGGVGGVGGAGKGVGGGGFFEGVGDGVGVVVDLNAAEVWGDEVGPSAGECVEPADIPSVGDGVKGADVEAEDDEFAGEGGHAVLVSDGVAVEDEASEPLGFKALPIAVGGFDAGVALPTADEEGEGCELRGSVWGEFAEVVLEKRHGGLCAYDW